MSSKDAGCNFHCGTSPRKERATFKRKSGEENHSAGSGVDGRGSASLAECSEDSKSAPLLSGAEGVGRKARGG